MTPELEADLRCIEDFVMSEGTISDEDSFKNIKTALESAQAEPEKARVDAERYRWLRDEANSCQKPRAPMVFNVPYGAGDWDWQDVLYGDELDDAIDAARSQPT